MKKHYFVKLNKANKTKQTNKYVHKSVSKKEQTGSCNIIFKGRQNTDGIYFTGRNPCIWGPK